MEPILKVEGLTKLFPVKKQKLLEERRFVHAVEDVSFEVYQGGTLGIVGESGSGKSTLARAILALTPVTSGSVFYQGEDITNFRVGAAGKRRLRSELQMVFQDPYASLNPRMKIGEAIVEPMLINGQAKTRAEAREKACHLLETVGLRQRIGIVRALSVNPKLLFCDESVSALDVSVQAQILNLFNELKERFHLTYVFIGHDLAVIRYISDQILVMYLGKIMEIAPYDQLFGEHTHPYTQALVSAVPEPSTAGRSQRILLEGDIPSPVNPPRGCRFCNRCFQAEEICRQEEPQMIKTGERHWIRCHFAKPAH